MSSLQTATQSTIMNDNKPDYSRKPRKDGSSRKARIFGRPWWHEKAGWLEERFNDRRAAILGKFRERWSDFSAFDENPPSDKEIQDWIRPLIATFDDTSWCLPGESDPQKRLDEQILIYTAWAKHIYRESNRANKSRLQTPIKQVPPTSSQSIGAPSQTPGHASSSQYTSSPLLVTLKSSEVHGISPIQRLSTRTMDSALDKDSVTTENDSEMNALASTWQFSKQAKSSLRDARGSSKQPRRSLTTYSFVEPDFASGTVNAISRVASDDKTEITELSDSEPARHISKKTKIRADAEHDHNDKGGYARKWQDSDWDDVVVTVDATEWNGEFFPIPMTMLKPGPSRSLYRWDDFELRALYDRLDIEAGKSIDRHKYMVVWRANGRSTAINTPGKYKLMLKEFSEKTRRSSSMILFVRVTERAAFLERTNRAQSKQNRVTNRARDGFTGAASDFSSDSETESTQPSPKRQRQEVPRQPTSPTRPRSGISTLSLQPEGQDNDQLQQPTPALIVPPGVKTEVRDSPVEFTQDTQMTT